MNQHLTRIIAFVFLLTGFEAPLFSQAPSIQWQKSYGGSNYDEMNGGDPYLVTSDGGFLINGISSSTDGDVTGNHGSYDFWLLKSDANGNISWQKSLGGSDYDNGVAAQPTTDGGYILVGYSASNDGDVSGNHGSYDGWIAKLDANRNIVWQKSLGGSNFDYLWGIQQTSDGGYIAAGTTSSNDGDVSGNHGSSDVWVVRLDANGNIIWKKCYGGSNSDGANSIRQTSDGGYIVGCYSTSHNGDVGSNAGLDDYWILKLDAIGNIIWQKAFGGSGDDVCQSVRQTSDLGYIVAGYSTSNDGLVSGNHSGGDDWIIKLDVNGSPVWTKTLGGSGGEYTYSAEQTSDGGYIVGGYTTSNNGDVTNNHGGTDYWVVKLNSTGNISWQKTLGGSGDDYGQNAVATSDGGYIVSGFSDSNDGDVTGNHGNFDYWMVKLGACISATTPTVTASINPVCGSASTTLSISSGSLNGNSQWQWYSGGCGAENSGTSLGSGTSLTVSPTANTTYYARGEGGCAVGSCGSIPVNVTPPQGNPSVFGNNVWNVYAWNVGGQSATDSTWNYKYSGYYVDTNFNFNTENRWNRNGAPSDASGYLGCPVGDDNHSWSAERTGFPCGYYRIDIPGHDDEAQLFINGVEVWFHDGCCDFHNGVWYGFLNSTSSIEFRGTEGGGFSYGSIAFVSLTSSTSTVFTLDCNHPSVTLSTSAVGNYLWNTGATTSSITVNTPGAYSVSVSDGSGCSASNNYNVLQNSVSLTGPNCVGVADLSASFLPTIEKVDWMLNDSVVKTSYSTYDPTAGSAVGSVGDAFGVFVDDANNVYASDFSNFRVLRWSPGSPVPTVVAGGYGYGSGANQLKFTNGIYVDHDLNVYVVDRDNYRVQKWAPGATSGTTVAGGHGFGNGLNQFKNPYGITLDNAGNIYVSDEGNNSVVKWAPGASSGVVVAGGSLGNALNQLNSPRDVAVDDAGNVYVADAYNDRVMKWVPGATSGVVVAGGNGYGLNSNQLEYPTGIVVDHYGNLYISQNDNSNIVKVTPGTTTWTYVTGQCCGGNNATWLHADMALGNDGSIYVCDNYNNRIFRYPMTASSVVNTFTPTVGGNYKLVSYTFDGCVLTSSTVTTKHPILNVTGNPYFCSGGSTTLDAGNHQQYLWSTGATTEAITIDTGANYSITVTDSGCSTTSTIAVFSRTPVITVTPTPSLVCIGDGNDTSQLKTALAFEPSAKSSKTYYISANQLIGLYNTCNDGGRFGYSYYTNGFNFQDFGLGNAVSMNVEFYISTDYNAPSHSIYIDGIQNGTFSSPVNAGCQGASPEDYENVALTANGYTVGGNNSITFSNNNTFGISPGPNTNNYLAKVTVYYTGVPTSYSWAPTGDTTANPIVTPASTTTYTVTTNSYGCANTATATVTVSPSPGDTTVFGTNGWNVYVWNDGGASNTGHSWSDKYSGYYTDTSFNFNTENMWNRNGAPSDAATYNGCSVHDDNHSWSAKRKGFPCGIYQIDVPGHDDEAQLFVNDSMVWEHIGCCDSHTNVWTGFLDNNSTIVFRGTEGGGASYGSINIILKGGINSSGPTTFCPGYSVQLTSDSSGSYLWSTGATTQSITVDTSGIYSVTVTSGGCSHTFSQQVTVAVLDTPTIYSNTNFAYCPINQGSLYIVPDPRVQTIAWSNGIPFPGIDVPPGTYSVTVSDALGCSATSRGTIVSDVVGTDSSFGNNSWKVNAYSQGLFQAFAYYYGYYYYYYSGREWFPDDYSGYYIDTTLNFNSQDRWDLNSNPSTASGYLGCNVPNDLMSWSAKRRGFACGVYQIDVTSHDENSELWVNGIKVWSADCCNTQNNVWTGPLNASSTVEFKVNEMLGGSDGSLRFTKLDSTANFVTLTGHQFVCTGQSQQLTSSVLGNYLWSNGGTTNPVSVSQSGSYSVTVTDLNGCVLSSAPVSVTILPNAAPVAKITAPVTNICNWNLVTLTSDSTNGNSWSTAQISQSISTNVPNDYILTVSNSVTCYDQDTVHITSSFTPPAPVAGNGGNICSGSSATLTASGLAPGGQVASFNGTNQYIDVTQDVPEHNFTIEMWVKTTVLNTGIFSVTSGYLGNNGNDRHLFLYNGILYTRVYNSNTLSSGIKINDGKWHHIALTVQDDIGQKLYVDGSLSPNTNSYDHSDFTNQTDFRIGYSGDATSPYFNGEIDNVRIWSDARTASDIQNNMALETPLSTDSLVYASSLNGNLNVTAGNVGTMPNGISYAAPDYYTYTWTGTGAPVPSTSETQITSALTSGGSYSVTASADGSCSPSNGASTNVNVVATIAYYPDADGDGYGSSTATPIMTCTNPGSGYVTNNLDCNDSNANVHPGVTEICNGIDDNCNGQIDEGVTSTFYADADGDGYGNPASSTQACSAPQGYVTDNTDCNDNNTSVHPGATEICNGIDDNCNGQIDEGVTTTFYADADGDGYGNPNVTTQACSAPAGYVSDNTDCHDGNKNVHPGATEICNGIDDNCNGQIDEGVKSTFYADADGDGYGNPNVSTQACSAPAGYVSNNTDCNDANKNIHPGAPDICNGIDDNCNGVIDENAITATVTPTGSVTFCAGSSLTLTANSGTGITYQWLKNNKNVSGATKQTYVATATGNFKVKESNTFSCSSTSATTTVTKVAKPAAVIIALGNLNICTTGSVTLQANAGIGLKYQWIKGAANIAGATARTYVATTKGTYKCTVTNASYCSKTSNSLKVTNSCIKDGQPEEDITQSTLLIYPNPTEGKFILDLKTDEVNDGQAKIMVMNMVGQIVYAENGSIVNGELRQEINFPASAASGIYIAKVICNDHTYQGKLIYQH